MGSNEANSVFARQSTARNPTVLEGLNPNTLGLWPDLFVCLFWLPKASVLTLVVKRFQTPNSVACECGPTPSHGFMKANTIPGSSAAFVPPLLSHEFNPTINIDFHFNLLKRELHAQISLQPERKTGASNTYLSLLWPGASSNDPLSSAIFQLFLIWPSPWERK